MLQRYLSANITEPALLRVLMAIGELKAACFETLKTVKNRDLNFIATRKLLSRFLTDGLLEISEFNSYSLSVKCLEELQKRKVNTKHLERRYKDSGSAHSRELRQFLLPFLFAKNHHAVFYPELKYHDLRPDACLITKEDGGYRIRFIEVENTGKHEGYLLEKYKKYCAFGADEGSWSGWWKRHHKDLDLPYCKQEQFCFSVLCKGKKTFDYGGWEWISPE